MTHHPAVALHDLHLHRGSTRILESIEWTVRRGERWAILGANGSGKTTLLKVLTGEISASGGSIEVLGQRYGQSDWRALRRRTAVVGSALRARVVDQESVLELIVGGLRGELNLWRAPSEVEVTRAKAVAAETGLLFPLSRLWRHLSQGERQRALMARAYAQGPDLLLLDEPCAGLDPVARARFLQDLHTRPADAGPATVLVTHHLEEIGAGTTHLLLLHRGRVHAAGPLEEVLTEANLRTIYEARVTLRGDRGRWALEVG